MCVSKQAYVGLKEKKALDGLKQQFLSLPPDGHLLVGMKFSSHSEVNVQYDKVSAQRETLLLHMNCYKSYIKQYTIMKDLKKYRNKEVVQLNENSPSILNPNLLFFFYLLKKHLRTMESCSH